MERRGSTRATLLHRNPYPGEDGFISGHGALGPDRRCFIALPISLYWCNTKTWQMIALCERPQRGEEIAMPQVGPGTYITIRFEAFLESGTRVLSNEDETPLVFRFGSGEVFSRIEQEIAGLSAGDIREFFVQPEEAFGRIDHAKILRVPLQDFPRGKELKRGMVLRVETKEGRKNLCFVGDIQKDHFVLDFNHPLAGKTLKYRVRVLDVHKIT